MSMLHHRNMGSRNVIVSMSFASESDHDFALFLVYLGCCDGVRVKKEGSSRAAAMHHRRRQRQPWSSERRSDVLVQRREGKSGVDQEQACGESHRGQARWGELDPSSSIPSCSDRVP